MLLLTAIDIVDEKVLLTTEAVAITVAQLISRTI